MTIYLNEPSLTDNFSLHTVTDERLTAVSISSESHTPTAGGNYSYMLLEAPSTASTPTFVPSRTVNWTSGTPASNAYVSVDSKGKVRHHSDDSGVGFAISYYGKGTPCRALENNQKKTAQTEGYRLYAQGAGIVPGSTKTIIYEEGNFDIGGLACILASTTADFGSSGNCEFPSTTSGYWRKAYVYAKRLSDTSQTGTLIASFSTEASVFASCPDPTPIEKALLLAVVKLQAAGTGAGNCNNLSEDSVYRVTKHAGFKADSGGGGDAGDKVYQCLSTVTRGDTVSWIRTANGFPKYNSTLKKADSFVTTAGTNCSALPVVGIAGMKTDDTHCYLHTIGNDVYISHTGIEGQNYYQAVDSAGNISKEKTETPFGWVQKVAIGSWNTSRFALDIQSPYQVGVVTPPDDGGGGGGGGGNLSGLPELPPNMFYANVSNTGVTNYDFVRVHSWLANTRPLMVRVKADNQTNCPNPSDPSKWATPPAGCGLYYPYAIVLDNNVTVYNSTYNIAKVQYKDSTPIDSKNQTGCSWDGAGAFIFASNKTFGYLTKTAPRDIRNVQFCTGKDSLSLGPQGAGNVTYFDQQHINWRIVGVENGTGIVPNPDPEPPGTWSWVKCTAGTAVGNFIGLSTSVVGTYEPCTNAYTDYFESGGAHGICWYKPEANSTHCKMMVQGPYRFGDTTDRARYFLSEVAGAKTSVDPYHANNVNVFRQIVGFGCVPMVGSNETYDFQLVITPPRMYLDTGTVDNPIIENIQGVSTSGSPLTTERKYISTQNKITILDAQIGLLVEDGNLSEGTPYVSMNVLKNNASSIFRTTPKIYAGAGNYKNTFVGNGTDITKGVLNATVIGNITLGDTFTVLLSANGTYETAVQPYGTVSRIRYTIY